MSVDSITTRLQAGSSVALATANEIATILFGDTFDQSPERCTDRDIILAAIHANLTSDWGHTVHKGDLEKTAQEVNQVAQQIAEQLSHDETIVQYTNVGILSGGIQLAQKYSWGFKQGYADGIQEKIQTAIEIPMKNMVTSIAMTSAPEQEVTTETDIHHASRDTDTLYTAEISGASTTETAPDRSSSESFEESTTVEQTSTTTHEEEALDPTMITPPPSGIVVQPEGIEEQTLPSTPQSETTDTISHSADANEFTTSLTALRMKLEQFISIAEDNKGKIRAASWGYSQLGHVPSMTAHYQSLCAGLEHSSLSTPGSSEHLEQMAVIDGLCQQFRTDIANLSSILDIQKVQENKQALANMVGLTTTEIDSLTTDLDQIVSTIQSTTQQYLGDIEITKEEVARQIAQETCAILFGSDYADGGRKADEDRIYSSLLDNAEFEITEMGADSKQAIQDFAKKLADSIKQKGGAEKTALGSFLGVFRKNDRTQLSAEAEAVVCSADFNQLLTAIDSRPVILQSIDQEIATNQANLEYCQTLQDFRDNMTSLLDSKLAAADKEYLENLTFDDISNNSIGEELETIATKYPEGSSIKTLIYKLLDFLNIFHDKLETIEANKDINLKIAGLQSELSSIMDTLKADGATQQQTEEATLKPEKDTDKGVGISGR